MSASNEIKDDLSALRPRWMTSLDPHTYRVTRFLFLRFLGLIYTVAFLVAVNQLVPLVGAEGLDPAFRHLEQVRFFLRAESFLRAPTLFWVGVSDGALQAVSYLGLGLALALLFGFANSITLFLLWLFYLSIVQVGQVFWGYGWESLLLETGFLAVFLAPPLDPRPFPHDESPPKPVIWLLRWLVFRLMLGAGLIKLRGDVCWRDLTCLMTHYETQPLPNPFSWYLHQLPPFVQKASVLFNHYAELLAPFFLFYPRWLRLVGGGSVIAFQLLLIVSGNLSWLNWLTITIAIACFDDQALARLCPARLRMKVAALATSYPLSRRRKVAVYAYCTVVAVFSINPIVNLISPSQRMNSSFDPFYLVNTYGAFGSVGRERYEIILEGTSDDDPREARWIPYEFRCKPGDPERRPCFVAPYQYRIDWQIWFAAMSDYRHHPWVVHLVYHLLSGRPSTLSLLESNPFPEKPPHYVRAELYRYQFTSWGEPTRAYWKRERVDMFLPPLSLDDPELLAFLRQHGWL